MRNHLGVGVRPELETFGLQLGAQLPEVLNNAVLYHDKLARHIGMGMRVAFTGLAVGGPAGVTDADIACHRRFSEPGCQIVQLTDIAPDGDATIFDHRDAGRIVTAIFQLPQPGQNYLRSVTRTDVTNDTTHENPLLTACRRHCDSTGTTYQGQSSSLLRPLPWHDIPPLYSCYNPAASARERPSPSKVCTVSGLWASA